MGGGRWWRRVRSRVVRRVWIEGVVLGMRVACCTMRFALEYNPNSVNRVKARATIGVNKQ